MFISDRLHLISKHVERLIVITIHICNKEMQNMYGILAGLASTNSPHLIVTNSALAVVLPQFFHRPLPWFDCYLGGAKKGVSYSNLPTICSTSPT